MDHLYSSVVKIQRLQIIVRDGKTPIHDWVDQPKQVRCRLDLTFLRPGKDAPPAIEAGVAPDRVGIMFCSSAVDLQAGDRVVTVSGPVTGTFEIKAIPDVALDYSSGHHIEVQIFETNQTLTSPAMFPGQAGAPEPEELPEETPPID